MNVRRLKAPTIQQFVQQIGNGKYNIKCKSKSKNKIILFPVGTIKTMEH